MILCVKLRSHATLHIYLHHISVAWGWGGVAQAVQKAPLVILQNNFLFTISNKLIRKICHFTFQPLFQAFYEEVQQCLTGTALLYMKKSQSFLATLPVAVAVIQEPGLQSYFSATGL